MNKKYKNTKGILEIFHIKSKKVKNVKGQPNFVYYDAKEKETDPKMQDKSSQDKLCNDVNFSFSCRDRWNTRYSEDVPEKLRSDSVSETFSAESTKGDPRKHTICLCLENGRIESIDVNVFSSNAGAHLYVRTGKNGRIEALRAGINFTGSDKTWHDRKIAFTKHNVDNRSILLNKIDQSELYLTDRALNDKEKDQSITLTADRERSILIPKSSISSTPEYKTLAVFHKSAYKAMKQRLAHPEIKELVLAVEGAIETALPGTMEYIRKRIPKYEQITTADCIPNEEVDNAINGIFTPIQYPEPDSKALKSLVLLPKTKQHKD